MEIQRLIEIVSQLRDPATGCPWDLEQTHQSLIPHLIEEAYEVIDAIQSGDNEHFAEELGDLLLQVVLHAQIAQDSGTFNIDTVAAKISQKLIERHPHVFGRKPEEEQSINEDAIPGDSASADHSATDNASPIGGSTELLQDQLLQDQVLQDQLLQQKKHLSTQEVESQWERIKGLKPLGSGLPAGLPETLRASKILRQITKRGKIAAQRPIVTNPMTQEELGDSLLGIIQTSIVHNLDPHMALRKAIDILIEEANENLA